MTAGVLALVGFLALGVAGRLLHAEATTRLEALPAWILRRASARLPESARADQLEEWLANVADVIHPQTEGLPITRLVRGLRYSMSALVGARRLARELDPSAPRTFFGAYAAASHRLAMALDGRLARRGVRYSLRFAAFEIICKHYHFVFFVPFAYAVEVDEGAGAVSRLILLAAGAFCGCLAVAGVAGAWGVQLPKTAKRRGWSEWRTYVAAETARSVRETLPNMALVMTLAPWMFLIVLPINVLGGAALGALFWKAGLRRAT